MNLRLLIWLPQDSHDPWAWGLSSGAELIKSGSAASDQEKMALRHHDFRFVIFILPGQKVSVFESNLPKMDAKSMQSAARFAVEEQLADSLDAQHIVLSASEPSRIFVVAENEIDHIEKIADVFDTKNFEVYVDYDCLPRQMGEIQTSDSLISPGPLGYSIDHDWVDAFIQDGQLTRDTKLTKIPVTSKVEILAQIAQTIEQQIPVNIGQGRTNQALPILQIFPYFRMTAIFASIVMILLLLLIAIEGRAMHRLADQQKMVERSLYKDHTGKRAPTHPASYLTRLVNRNAGKGQAFSQSFAILKSSMLGIHGSEIRRLSYDKGSGILRLTFRFQSYEDSLRLTESIEENGINITMSAMKSVGEFHEGDAIIQLNR